VADIERLRRAARAIFDDVLKATDARRAVLDAVEVCDESLRVCDTRFDLHGRPTKIYSVAIGKAATAMASALDERLGERLTRGVVSAPPNELKLSANWRVFAGGHPLPDESSLEAARAAFEILREANDSSSKDSNSLVIFLISGGGSAMLEWPRDARVTLDDLREANRALVSCGASIAEVNAVRRALSSVKGGGLSQRAPRAAQVTLIVSDVCNGRESDVASGPTLPTQSDTPAVKEIITRYKLAARLPANVLRALEETDARTTRAESPNIESSNVMLSSVEPLTVERTSVLRKHFVLLDNERACEAAAESARARGFAVELARDLVEQSVDEGAALMVSRLAEFQRREGAGDVCLISGGEFSCPVRGAGIGGRNAETALRCAFEFEKITRGRTTEETARGMVALCAGTDGIDGNSPAAGALADTTTLLRARELNLDARKFLDESDTYSFFRELGDALEVGPTGTNVRDVRILLAS
jgi:glycerate 2-kinase